MEHQGMELRKDLCAHWCLCSFPRLWLNFRFGMPARAAAAAPPAAGTRRALRGCVMAPKPVQRGHGAALLYAWRARSKRGLGSAALFLGRATRRAQGSQEPQHRVASPSAGGKLAALRAMGEDPVALGPSVLFLGSDSRCWNDSRFACSEHCSHRGCGESWGDGARG